MEVSKIRELKSQLEVDLRETLDEKLKEFYIQTGIRPGEIKFAYNANAFPVNGEIQEPFVITMQVSLTI